MRKPFYWGVGLPSVKFTNAQMRTYDDGQSGRLSGTGLITLRLRMTSEAYELTAVASNSVPFRLLLFDPNAVDWKFVWPWVIPDWDYECLPPGRPGWRRICYIEDIMPTLTDSNTMLLPLTRTSDPPRFWQRT